MHNPGPFPVRPNHIAGGRKPASRGLRQALLCRGVLWPIEAPASPEPAESSWPRAQDGSRRVSRPVAHQRLLEPVFSRGRVCLLPFVPSMPLLVMARWGWRRVPGFLFRAP